MSGYAHQVGKVKRRGRVPFFLSTGFALLFFILWVQSFSRNSQCVSSKCSERQGVLGSEVFQKGANALAEHEFEGQRLLFSSGPIEPNIVAWHMRMHIDRMDELAAKCSLVRSSAVHWRDDSNYDNLTKWKNPAVKGAFFDHALSFRYEWGVPKEKRRFRNYPRPEQCQALLKGHNFEELRKSPLVLARPDCPQAQAVDIDPNLLLIAVVFPQFHTMKDNDEFWGTNFTEWSNVKRALFNPWSFLPIRHPIAPSGYYNILDSKHRERMGQLAEHFGIHGLCYHHYWFGCGRVLMDDPLQRMMREGTPHQPFCLIWANSDWSRRWSGINPGEVLLRQTYGPEECWREHFQWLLPYFRSPRYLRVDGKPLFPIYDIQHLGEHKADAMLDFLRELALGAGLPGLHVVQCLTTYDEGVSPLVDGVLEYHPNVRYGNLSANVTANVRLHPTHYRGENMGWDNFPRHSSNPRFRGRSSKDDPPHVERRLFHKMAAAREDPNAAAPNYFFLTAWNEWGEGNIAEPDNVYGYANLNSIMSAYIRSKGKTGPRFSADALLHQLLQAMKQCELVLDAEYYLDMQDVVTGIHTRKMLNRFRSSPKILEKMALGDLKESGFSLGKDFRLVPEKKGKLANGSLLCRELQVQSLDFDLVEFIFSNSSFPEKITNSICETDTISTIPLM